MPTAASPSRASPPCTAPCTTAPAGPRATRCSTSPGPPGASTRCCPSSSSGTASRSGRCCSCREWGLSWTHPLPRRATDHKQALIRNMLALYRDLPFVLIGDSGQHDPEVYAQIVEEHPGGCWRSISATSPTIPPGSKEIVRLAGAVARSGSSLVLPPTASPMAEHAAGIGLITRRRGPRRRRACRRRRPPPAARPPASPPSPKPGRGRHRVHDLPRRRRGTHWSAMEPCPPPWWSSRNTRPPCPGWPGDSFWGSELSPHRHCERSEATQGNTRSLNVAHHWVASLRSQ